MLRLLCIALFLFLSLQLAVADPASTVLRVPRHSKSSSLVLAKSVLSALLVPRGKFTARQECPSGYQQCTNYPEACAPIGSFCCNDLYNCPDDTTVRTFASHRQNRVLPDECYNQCFESECCPNTAQTCNGNSCCNPGSECCNDDTCCESGYSCCNDSTGGCCPTGTTCIAGSDQCSTGGPTGGGGTSVLTSVAVTTPSKSTVQPKTTSSSSHTSTINEPTTTRSSSTSTASSTRSTSNGFPQIGAAPRGIALAPGKQLVALAAVVGLPILHNVAQAL